MKRKIGSVMVVVATMAAGCSAGDLGSGAGTELAATEQRQEAEPLFSTADIASILIFGDAFQSIDALGETLTGLGHTVTVEDDYGLPDNLAQFNTIWHVGLNAPLTLEEQAALVDYVSGGGGLHLSGEASGSDSMNDSLTAVVHELVVGGSGIEIGRQNNVPGGGGTEFYLIHAGATGSVAREPNTVVILEMSAAGGIGGLSHISSNTLANGGDNLDRPVAAVWDSSDLVSGTGALSVVMDSNWLLRVSGPQNDNAKLIENLQEFLTGVASTNQPPDAVAEIVPGQNLDCDDGSGQPRDNVPVDLDATGTTDDNTPFEDLTFTWYENGEVIGTGPTPTVDLGIGQHTVTLIVFDGEAEGLVSLSIEITCSITCTPGSGFWTFCHPGCPCNHGEGDCDIDADCKPGMVCLHDAGFAFGFEDNEVDVCSAQCPILGVASWNYCSPLCPCDVGEGDCDSDAECMPGLVCQRDIGPAFGWDREVDVCEPI